jgi:putative acetyltransferase
MANDRRFDRLLDRLYELAWFGWSNDGGKSQHVRDFIPAEGQVSADQFATWVILADNLDPDSEQAHEQKWHDEIRALFVECMGAENVDALELKEVRSTDKGGIEFRIDDLSGAEVRALVARHLAGMHADSPPESVHAFDIGKLRQPGVTFWSAWIDGELAGMGAMKQLDAERGEVKSMRVADRFLGRGVGRATLLHIIGEARVKGLKSLWLETGSTPSFDPALKLYESEGFAFCGPFGDYREDPFSRFMWRAV